MSDENKNQDTQPGAGEGGEKVTTPEKKETVIEVKQTQGLDQEKAKRILKISRLVMLILIFMAFGFLFLEYGCAKIPLQNDAMEPNFPAGQNVLYDRIFKYHDGVYPACGSPSVNLRKKFIILFKKKVGTRNSELCSRIIALSGDTVSLKDARIYVNGVEASGVEPGAVPLGKVPDLHFVVLNDNAGSLMPDSRVFGYVKAGEIYGRVVTRLPAWVK